MSESEQNRKQMRNSGHLVCGNGWFRRKHKVKWCGSLSPWNTFVKAFWRLVASLFYFTYSKYKSNTKHCPLLSCSIKSTFVDANWRSFTFVTAATTGSLCKTTVVTMRTKLTSQYNSEWLHCAFASREGRTTESVREASLQRSWHQRSHEGLSQQWQWGEGYAKAEVQDHRNAAHICAMYSDKEMLDAIIARNRDLLRRPAGVSSSILEDCQVSQC